MALSDSELGMDRKISRRDLLQKSVAAGIGGSLATQVSAESAAATTSYPPTLTGLRGSHPGSFELAHALRDGSQFSAAQQDQQHFDLIVVGAGISGLAAAYYYRQRYGNDARILLLENHDDFGGHAKRNEFHQGGTMRLSLGGTHNLEHWDFSKTVWSLLEELGINVTAMLKQQEFAYGTTAKNGNAMWFDQQTYGTDKLVAPYTLEWWQPGTAFDCIEQFPLSEQAKSELRALFKNNNNVFAGQSAAEVNAYLARISYPQFLRRHAGLSQEAIQIFSNSQHGAWGIELSALSAREGLESGLPGLNLIGRAHEADAWEYPVAMFPDGNASLARLLVQRLIPAIAPGTTANNVAVARFDYRRLDQPRASVRLRLNATVVNAMNTASGVAITYAHQGQVRQVRGKHCVMACYHSILPYLCPDLPEQQKEAQRYQVKIPLVLANVLLRSSRAMDQLGIDNVACPGRMFGHLFLAKGINTGGYSHPMQDSGSVPLVFWGSISPDPSATDLKAQLRSSRKKMLELSLKDYEREIRTVLHGLLGRAGFDVKRDVLAITVNRWPHGYSYAYMDLWDADVRESNAPHLLARQQHGNITFANADAAAYAYTQAAIEQAHRAIGEF